MSFWKTVLAVVIGVTIHDVADVLVTQHCAQPGACDFAR